MAKNDMPGMKGQQPTNPFEGMWGPIGAGNAAPYGGNQTPWINPGGQQPQGWASILQALKQRQQQQQAPQAATQPLWGRAPLQSNANSGSIPEMAAASSLAPSQPQALIDKFANLPMQAQMGIQGSNMGGIGGGQMLGGNVPPNVQALMSQMRMNQSPVEQQRTPMDEVPQPVQEQRPSLAPSGSFFSRLRPRNG